MKLEALSAANLVQLPKVQGPAAEAGDKGQGQPGAASVVREVSAPTRKITPAEAQEKIESLAKDGLFSVRFEVYAEGKEPVVRIVDKESGEVIRQVPPEELLRLFKTLEDLRGLLLDTRS